MANNNEVRLQKFMAEQGVASRRKSEDLIRAGKVKVNGHVAQIGQKINPRKDLVTVGKQKLTNVKNRKMIYIMLHKPRGYVTTVSDDGSFTNCMTHPSHNYAKVYRVTVRPSVSDEILYNLRNGIEIDGRMTAPAEVTVITTEENRVVLEFILHEGRNREIRKMCESQGLEVARLKRVSVGSLKLGMLPQGKYRELSEQEVKKLLRSAGHTSEK